VKIDQAKQSDGLSVGFDCSDLHSWLRGLRRNDIWRIHSSKLGLRRFRYPAGRIGLDDRQRDQRGHDEYRQRKKRDIPIPIGTVTVFLKSIKRAMHGHLHGENLHPTVN
jgi:hypothetical protein